MIVRVLVGWMGLAMVLMTVIDVFEVIILPRRVSRRFRLVVLFYRVSWPLWERLAKPMSERWRDWFLSLYGPLSLPVLLAVWAAGAIAGYSCLYIAFDTSVSGVSGPATFGDYMYLSGSTFFTLGYGDVAPLSAAGRGLAVLEAGSGLGLLAIVIGYLPVIYQSFSRREVKISLLDARAGSPPTAERMLLRHSGKNAELAQLLAEWEQWSADCLESMISYPVLGYFRSQHNNQSWLTAVTALLDTCVLVLVLLEDGPRWQARLTFAMGRHLVVDLAQVFNAPPMFNTVDRLVAEDVEALCDRLTTAGVRCNTAGAVARVASLRRMYEPYAIALARRMHYTLPAWIAPAEGVENWQTSAWERLTSNSVSLLQQRGDVHES